MAYTKAGMKATDKYVKENYDKIVAKVPKGRKAAVEAFAKENGQSVNGLVNDGLIWGCRKKNGKGKPRYKYLGSFFMHISRNFPQIQQISPH